tara:strand:- start:245 stop:1975 length:1731 start_codon:yes stop_codon:yes gene_type:complete
MASGDGLKKTVKRFDDPEIYRKSDLVLCARFEDVYGFFLFSELYDDKYLTNTQLIYDKPGSVKFEGETKNKLSKKNNLISINGNVINKKVSLVKLFQFNVFTEPKVIPSKIQRSGSFKNSFSYIFDYLNGVNPAFKDSTGRLIRQTNFLSDSNIKKINAEANKYDTHVMRVLDKGGFIIPEDVKNFSVFIGIKPVDFNDVSITFGDLPRLCDTNFLKYIFLQEGRKKFKGGNLCYTVIPYDKNQKALVPNVKINDAMHITSINYKQYTNNNFVFDRKACDPRDFEINDKVIGFLRNGLYVLNKDDTILQIESEETEYFRSVSDGKRGIIENFRKNFRYPRTVLSILIMRSSFNIADFDTTTSRQSSIHYAEGFYNTLSLSKSGMPNTSIFGLGLNPDLIIRFRDRLYKEFFEFIKYQFLENLVRRSTSDTRSKSLYQFIKQVERKCYLESEEYARKRGPRSSFSFLENLFGDNRRLTEKSSFVYIITNLMGVLDPNMAVIRFLGLPAIRHGHLTENQYESLRNISYFVRCSYTESCDEIVQIRGSENYSYLFLQDPSGNYTMYFNTKFAMFSEVYI